MAMKKMPPPESPDAYVASLNGWRRKTVEGLRDAVRAASTLEETIKWGHLVYFENGPVLLIRAEDERVLFGFWRGKRLLSLEPRLKAGGKYELANIELREGMTISPATATMLTREAIALNHSLGDPTKAAPKKSPTAKKPTTQKSPTKKQAAKKPAAKRPIAQKPARKKAASKTPAGTSQVKKKKK